jgi:Spy/CpxP family protein refolding chaperone
VKKQLCILSISAFLGAGAALAAPQDQNSAPPPEAGQHARRPMDPGRRVKMLSKKLNLTSDQQNQLLPILSSEQQQMESLHSDTSMSPQDKRAKMHSIREDSQNKIKGILTDTQKQQYDQMQQQMRERMQQRRNQDSTSSN